MKTKFIIEIESDVDTKVDINTLKFCLKEDLKNLGYIVYKIKIGEDKNV